MVPAPGPSGIGPIAVLTVATSHHKGPVLPHCNRIPADFVPGQTYSVLWFLAVEETLLLPLLGQVVPLRQPVSLLLTNAQLERPSGHVYHLWHRSRLFCHTVH